MFETLKNAWKIADLRKKILFTLFIILIFRIGSAIPVPYLELDALKETMTQIQKSGTILSYFNALSGGAFENGTIFAMGITPYINSSIIIQLLTVAIPALERMAKEGEEGHKKIAQITRYTTIGLGLLQGAAFWWFLNNSTTDKGERIVKFTSGWPQVFSAVVIILVFTAGTALMMWLGEQINEHGIGNGISILLFAGIIASAPSGIATLYSLIKLGIQGETRYLYLVPLAILVLLAMVVFIIFMDNAERKIPIQYAKRVVGRKMYGGQSTYMPIKVNMNGVLPIIFASSIISIPATIKMFKYGTTVPTVKSFWYKALSVFDSGGWVYPILYFILILFFAYFYVSIQYNPIEMANNLRKNSGAIPGIRPGKPTSDYISKIIFRITLIGALFLAVIALVPILVQTASGIRLAVGGTTLLIVVGVALETVKQLESQMLMRHYKGFLE